jgi:hypothetical protein
MLDITTWKPTAPYDFAGAAPDDAAGGARHPGDIRARAIGMLVQRGYSYVGEDSMGLPCYRSRSGAMLIGVGSCRCLAYAKVDGRLQVVAAARTLALLCRIGPESAAVPAQASVRPAAPPAPRVIPHAEPALMI